MVGCDFINTEVNRKKIKVLAVVGPTASGKTNFSVELAKALDGEIISADSMQIYKEMNIGTAKPTADEMQGIKHHLIDFVPLEENFSVADYVKLAKEKIFDINSRSKLPIICGGTGLYVNSLIDNVDFTKQNSDIKVRKELEQRLKDKGIEPLLEELKTFDPESAERIHPNNVLRIIRAIEIYKVTGITMTQQIENSKKIDSPFSPLILGLDYRNRDVLYEKINRRVDLMIENGLLEEARKILSKKCSKTAMNAICYKELLPYFEGTLSLEMAVDKIKQSTRNYAKRQLTWFRKDKRIQWIHLDEYNDFKENLKKYTKNIEIWKSM